MQINLYSKSKLCCVEVSFILEMSRPRPSRKHQTAGHRDCRSKTPSCCRKTLGVSDHSMSKMKPTSAVSKWVKNPNLDRYRRSFVIVKLRKIRQQHAPCGSFGLFFCFVFFDWIFCVCSVLGLKPLEQSDVLQFSDTTDELYMFLILVFTLHTFKVLKKKKSIIRII